MPAGLDGNPEPITSPARRAVLTRVADEIIRRRSVGGVLLVAIDGIDGGGKSTFADELAVMLEADVPVIRSTADSFHNPRAVRWRRGKLSPIGFYRDSHDLDILREILLDPLRSAPPVSYRAAAFDEPSDAPVSSPSETPRAGSVLLFDGLFLQRPELRHYWDLSIFLDGERRVTEERLERSTADCPPGPSALVHLASRWAVLRRYVEGFRLYVDECDPTGRADVVVDNNDLLRPTATFRRGG
jgi:uridine kinase